MRELANTTQLDQLIDQMASAVNGWIAQSRLETSWAVIGIRSRGDLLAKRLHKKLPAEQVENRLGILDITLYRDDLSEVGNQPIVRTTEIPFNLDGLNIVLVDDVLMTGRSIRAALQSLMDLGRPRRVWLMVLVDRGGRELPITPDFVAINLCGDDTLSPEEIVSVQLTPLDPRDSIMVQTRPVMEQGI